METIRITINGKNLLLSLEKFNFYTCDKLTESYLIPAYFNFSLPLHYPFRELVMDENKKPKIFHDGKSAQI